MTVYERAFGMANLDTGTAINPGSILHVASVSKQFTVAAIMLLARDGRLSPDDDIRKYLPEIPDYGTTIMLRHLMNWPAADLPVAVPAALSRDQAFRTYGRTACAAVSLN